MRATWRWCAARSPASPSCWSLATPSLEDDRQCRAEALRLRPSAGSPRRRAAACHPRHRLAQRQAGRGSAFFAPTLIAAMSATLEAGEQGPAVPQFAAAMRRSLSCHACGQSHAMHELHGMARRASLPRAAPVPSLRPFRDAAAILPVLRRAPARSPLAVPVSSVSPRRSRRLFPAARVAVMASDTLSGPRAAAAIVESVEAHRVDILIGTQIVAKGHHFRCSRSSVSSTPI